MTAPVLDQDEQQLLALLGLVDVSRALALAAEDRYRLDIEAIYNEQAGSGEDGSPVVTAAVLAAVVVVIRRAMAAGVAEGARFAQAQAEALGLPSSLTGAVDFSDAALGNRLVQDFLAGQVAVEKQDLDRAAKLAELKRRAVLAVVSAVQAGRGLATEEMLAALAAILGTKVHKLWVARFDLANPPCKLCVRLHGHHVELGQPFAVPDSEPAPYVSPLGAPPRHPNCRCSLLLYLPDGKSTPGAPTPLSMQAYGMWALSLSDADREQYVAMTIVHVKPYTRMVDGHLQHVSGYYYDTKTGMKIPESQGARFQNVKEVSARQAKQISKTDTAARKATPKGGAPNLEWKPGTYKVDIPATEDDTQVIVHQDGSSTSIHKGKTEDADPARTAQFLSAHSEQGHVTKITDDPEVQDVNGPGPDKPLADFAKQNGTLADGHYILPKNKDWGGVHVKPDGTADLYYPDFQKSIKIKQTAVSQIAKGFLGEFEEVDEKDFTDDWRRQHKAAKAADKPSQDVPEGSGTAQGGAGQSAAAQGGKRPDKAGAGVNVAGQATTAADGSGGALNEAKPKPPEGGPGPVVKNGPSLFSVGKHMVQIEEGSQVYKSPKSKDTLYVLQPDGDLIKYNPQGAGVQATLVGSNANGDGKNGLLASLVNVTEDGDSIQDMIPAPGTGKHFIGGVEMTSQQLEKAIQSLSSNPSGNVVADLKRIGSPLAADGKFHQVAAPYKAYFNNKTKPALIQALKNAQLKTGSTPHAETARVAHMAEAHGLEEHQGSLGHTDTEAIHAALHAVDPRGSGHTHDDDGPGFIDVAGVPFPPATVSAAIKALKRSPKNETGVKKPLKEAGSPLAGLDLQGLANTSSVTDNYKGSNGKVHYGKLKPAVVALLQDALDKHQAKNPPTPPKVPSVPAPQKSVGGIPATEGQIKELQDWFGSVDFDTYDGDVEDLLHRELAHNPLAFSDWDTLVANKAGMPDVPDHMLNQVLHDLLNDHLTKKTPYTTKKPTVPVKKGPDFSKIPDVDIPDEPTVPAPGLMAAGLVVVEPDGSTWIYEPKGHFAGYEHTWPKGGQDAGLTLQQTAHKELFEETGISANITGYLGDYKRSQKEGGKVRMYVATRRGGTPLPDDPTPFEEGGSETASVKNVPVEQAMQMLNVQRDKRVLKDLIQFGTAGRAPATGKKKPDVTPDSAPESSPEIKLGSKSGTLDDLKLYKNVFDSSQSAYTPFVDKLPSDHPFKSMGLYSLATALGLDPADDYWALKQPISDALQHKIDRIVQKQNMPPPPPAPVSTATLVVAGKTVTKQDLLDAVEAVKNSPATGIKGPLKDINSPLAKVDLKAWIEQDPLSGPYKGGNGKVHYGKLKNAVAAVLQAKADEMVDGPTAEEAVPDVPPSGAPGDPLFDVPTTPVDGSPAEKVKAAWKNAKQMDSVPSEAPAFAHAFHQAATTGESSFTDEYDFSNKEEDFAGAPYFEITGDGQLFEIDDDGIDHKLSDAWMDQHLQGFFDMEPGLQQDLAEAGASLSDPGLYISTNGDMTLQVYPDGSGKVKNSASGQENDMDAESVSTILDLGTLTKVSDTPEDNGPANINGVQLGFYGDHPGEGFTVFSDGTVLHEGVFGKSTMSVDLAKPYIQSMGKSPDSSALSDPDDSLADAEKDKNGFLLGTYEFPADGSDVIVSKSGPEGVSPEYLAMSLIQGDAQYLGNEQFLPKSASVPGSTHSGGTPELAALVAKAKIAPLQDPWGDTTTAHSSAFQQAVKEDKSFYVWSNGSVKSDPPQHSSYLEFKPDGTVTSKSASGKVLKTWEPADTVARFDSVYDGPSVQGPVPDLPGTATEVAPDGTWRGHPVGTWTNGEGAFVEIGPDGPEISFDDAEQGMDEFAVLDMIDSGDLTWVSPIESPVPSTPAHLFDADAPKLSPFMTAGYTKMSWIDKPVLLQTAQKWAEESGFGGVAAQHLSTLKKDDLIKWLTSWSKGDWSTAYLIEAQKVKKHKKQQQHPGSPFNSTNYAGFVQKKMPPLVPGEVPAGTKVEGDWPSSYYGWDADVVDDYLLKANMQNPTGLSKWQKKDWAYHHFNGDKIETDSLSLLGQKNIGEGQVYSSPILPPVEKYAPGQAVPLSADFPLFDYSKATAKDWTPKQLDQYLNHVGPTKKSTDFLLKQTPETKAELVQLHAVAAAPKGVTTFKDPTQAKKEMKDILNKVRDVAHWNEAETSQFIKNITKLDKSQKVFTKNKEQPPLGGGSSSDITQLTDELGNPFLFKVYPEKFRVEAEHAAHELAGLAGIKVADSMLGTFEGKYGQFQAKVPSKGTLAGVAPTSLPISAMKDLVRAHVQDWVTSNDDAHKDNFLLTPDGQHVVPIDIARSFARFGNPNGMKLKVGQLSDWNTPYYDHIYKAALNGKLSDSQIDELYKESIKQAKRTAAIDDAKWAAAIEAGQKNRPGWGGGTTAKSLPDLVKQALARKNAAPEDFEKFWDGIYASLGRDKPAAAPGTLAPGVHAGFTPELIAHADAMGNHGAATFFAGAELEDGHMLAQLFNKSGGGQELHLSGQLRKDADAKLRSWLSSHVGADLSGASVLPGDKKGQFLADAQATNYASTIVEAAKTISHHHKQGDKNYNTVKINNFETMKTEVASKLKAAEAGNFPPKFKDWPEAQEEYKSLLNFYDAQIQKVQNLKDNNGQSKFGDFVEYPVTPPADKVLDAPIDLGPGIKVTKISSYFEQASIGPDGKLNHVGTDKMGQTGKTYAAELSDGTVIEYRSWNSADGVSKAQQGQLRIKVRNYDGTTSGAESAKTALQRMGLSMQEASEDDMELFYYRHLYAVMQDRSDGSTGKHKDVADYVKANLPGGAEGTPALEAAEELKRWREAWSRLDKEKFNTFLAGKKWMPKFSRASVAGAAAGWRGGVPYWERFDADMDALKAKPLLTHSLSDPSVAATLVKSGGLLSTEMRTQILGQWKGGMSSSADQSYGSSNFVFTRQNGVAGNYAQVYIRPEVAARTNNYAYNGDKFGNTTLKSSYAHFDLNKMTSHTSSSNELLIKRSVSLLDDIEMLVFVNQAVRQEAIDYLKSHGVTTIRGLAIEDRLVLQADKVAALAKIEAHRKTWKEEEE